MDLRDELMVLKEALAAARPIPFKKRGDEFIDAVSKIMALPALESADVFSVANQESLDSTMEEKGYTR